MEGGFKITKKIGDGAYGSVYEGETIPDGKGIAIKVNLVESRVDFIGSLRELDMLATLKGHPFVVGLAMVAFPGKRNPDQRAPDVRQDEIQLLFDLAAYDGVTLIYGGFTLYGYLKMAMAHAALALEFMHAKSIIHRDLKPGNLLWFRDGRHRYLKVCDFGLSKVEVPEEPKSPGMVTSWYRAPEVALGYTDYGKASDVWSLGCIFFEMVAKRAYLQGSGHEDYAILESILRKSTHPDDAIVLAKMDREGHFSIEGRRRPPNKMVDNIALAPASIEDFDKTAGSYLEFVDLIERMLAIDPTKRISATEVLDHAFFTGQRATIAHVRHYFPPVEDASPMVTIRATADRRAAAAIAFSIFNNYRTYRWYRHRVLFLAFDLFDRYLEHASEASDRDVSLKFGVCLYMAVKYVLPAKDICSFAEIVNLAGDEGAKDRARAFEVRMLEQVLRFRIHRPTILEEAAKDRTIPNPLDEARIANMLVFVGNINYNRVVLLRDLYREFCHLPPLPAKTSPIVRPVEEPEKIIVQDTATYIPTHVNRSAVRGLPTSVAAIRHIGQQTARALPSTVPWGRQ